MTNVELVPFKKTIFVIWLMLVVPCANASVQIISGKLADDKIVTAEYRVGATDKPAVLVLHGFLQTRNYLTVSNLAESATESGHTVLMPTLSLGINERKKSLVCDAIQAHSFEGDVAEIDYWINWLEKQGHKNIVVIGHSYGSLQLLGHIVDYNRSSISQLIATSLLDASREVPSEKRKAYMDDAEKRIANSDRSLGEYSLSYCKKYIAPAGDYLSYASWSRARILNSITASKVPITVILGSNDKRLDAKWKSDLSNHGAKVVMIDDANHFFSADQEFDLIDTIQMILQ